ncbi:TATA element modulatory factor isoform X1 [Neodiprion lecontei]|uniref:TATA element modulatory factor isoform X1 n=1 Tax=Neodiprion lecontei TaxID=441921 RepID=A0A6J0B9T1_NEOLC|nr:TATA element modulatory factor isoform X1 [Neodiprion lecontei]XP_015510966.2 TATA element modulatory factor isoform X1 [Neodiprion lecontei]XP_046588221.1 TATA element modulatory factor isoform X1 [Neodiprion lecontei]XP_046588222.1 TATA element modulatory factor isoform X1 [Neodiprion lecontei]
MSWFDASGIANLAKSALKEAQKTIDKALDIKEEEQKRIETPLRDENTAGDSTDFFAEWGIKTDNGQAEKSNEVTAICKEKSTTSVIWGSFAGSFFENPSSSTDVRTTSTGINSDSVLSSQDSILEDTHLNNTMTSIPSFSYNQNTECQNDSALQHDSSDRMLHSSPLRMDDTAQNSTNSNDRDRAKDLAEKLAKMRQNPVDSSVLPRTNNYESFKGLEALDLGESNDTIIDESFSNSQLIVDLDEDGARADGKEGRRQSLGNSFGMFVNPAEVIEPRNHDNLAQRRRSSDETIPEDSKKISVIRRQELNSANRVTNRTSVVSSESDMKSSDSVEILGSRSSPCTDCTTTPESDLYSFGQSTGSSAVGTKINSDSVEILPDNSSLTTSPGSVEILGEWKSESSPFVSPDDGESITPYDPNLMDPMLGGRHLKSAATLYAESAKEIEERQTLGGTPIIHPLQLPLNSPIAPSLSGACLSNRSSLPAKLSVEPKGDDISPDSVEVIPEIDESEEPSLADDSYTSASESTVLLTVMEGSHNQMADRNKSKALDFVDRNSKMHDSCPDTRQNVSISMLADTQLNLSLDSLKEKHSFRLALTPITTQPIRKPVDSLEFEVLDTLKSSTIELPDPDTFQENIAQLQKNEFIDCHDQQQQQSDTFTTDQSSCEETLIETSSADNATLVCQAEPKIVDTTTLTASSYVKNMLAEAMVEKIEAMDSVQPRAQVEATRDTSPISSESRSDLVKIGSDQTSGHTSGDELETATSSDIEIISRYSPNGDSSSTQSRQSPAKLQTNKSSDLLTKTLNKARGHSRQLSEISVGSDDTNVEIEKLFKRIQEMTEILEARESKLVDVSRINMELHECNESLRSQLNSIQKRAEENQELSQITDEYTQRLSALERKFQQAIRERDTLRKQMEQLKHEASTRFSSQELSSIGAEKDQVIKELREEGEILSKQQLQHSNIIKKLRSKEKESDSTIKQQREQIEEQSLELERLKRSLYAKEEIERTQIEAVHSLTAKTKRQEKEVLTLQEKLDDALNKLDTYKKSLEAAKTDLTETKQHLAFAEEELKEAIENAGESSQLSAQVRELKTRLRQAEETRVKREDSLRQENNELLKRLESSEERNEALSESVSMATKPLLRQLEQLQSNLSTKNASFLKQEKILSETIAELQRKLDTTVETNRSLREENVATKSKLTNLEAKINTLESEKDKLEKLCREKMLENSQFAEECKIHRKRLESVEESHAKQIKELKREVNSLENKLSMEKAATDAEKRKNHPILEQQQQGLPDDEPRLSPTSSIGRDSIGSLSSVWPSFNESTFESGSGRFGNVYESVRSGANSSTSMFENLQSQLKQRDGEVQQLQWELSRRNMERDALNSELSKLTFKVENLTSRLHEVELLNESLNDTRTKYDALLQMYGEKVEENQELRLDLEDVKEMYKTQIDQLLRREAQ